MNDCVLLCTKKVSVLENSCINPNLGWPLRLIPVLHVQYLVFRP